MKCTLLVLSLFFITCCNAQPNHHPLITELNKKIADKTFPKIDGILVKQHDQLLFENYYNGFTKDSLHDTRSSFKSVTSILAGIAVDKKMISPGDKIGRFFPELKDEGKRNITVQHLLEMRSGLNCEEFYEIGPECEEEMVKARDWIAFCLGVDLIREPGVNWSYNSNEPMLVGEIITRASGMTIMEFARKYLFEPLGIERYRWTISPTGTGMTAGSFYIKPADMLKIISMVQQKGKWNGQQIVSEEWIKQSTNCQIDIDFSFTRFSRIANARYESARYGFFWYRENLHYKNIHTEVLFSSGNGGQYMMYLPAYDASVVFTGSNYSNWRGKLPFTILLTYIIPMLEEKSK